MRSFLAVAALATALPCQQSALHRTAHPQETLQDGHGSVLPLGCVGPADFTEARTQILFPSQELPGPGATLVGIEVHCQDTLTLRYTSLEIDAFATTATSLSFRFADNIQQPVSALLRGTNQPVAYDSTRWSVLPQSNVYVHDGLSSLVIEVRKVVDPASASFATMGTTLDPIRVDRPGMVSSFGGPGSGASTAAVAQTRSDPLAVRLLWLDAPTVRLLGDQAPSGNQFGLGGSIVETIEGAPGSVVADFIGTSFLSPPRFFAPVAGLWLVDDVTLGVGVLPATGREQRRTAIPNDHNLVGLHLTYQSATIDLTHLAQFTNGADHFVNP